MIDLREGTVVVEGRNLGGVMDRFFCSADRSRAEAVGVCIDGGCAACVRHGAVETVRRSVRTGNMFEERPVEVRQFGCVACRSLSASQVVQRDRDRADPERMRLARSEVAVS